MAQDIHHITAVDWQPTLDTLGAIVEGYDDIAQCVRIILTTPKGADPHRPEFGCDLWRYVDHPLPQAVPHIIRETVDALRRWESRIQVVRVVPEIVPLAGLHLTIEWRLAGLGARSLLRVSEVQL